MESKQYQNRSGGGFNNRYSQQKKKTFQELALDVKKQFFNDNIDELLNMSSTNNLDSILQNIEKFVSEEGKSLSTSQLRNIYDKVKRLKDNDLNGLKLFRPNLAYIAGRSTNEKEKSLLAFIDLLIKSINSEKQVKEFKIFFEAVVAYHKFYGKQ